MQDGDEAGSTQGREFEGFEEGGVAIACCQGVEDGARGEVRMYGAFQGAMARIAPEGSLRMRVEMEGWEGVGMVPVMVMVEMRPARSRSVSVVRAEGVSVLCCLDQGVSGLRSSSF